LDNTITFGQKSQESEDDVEMENISVDASEDQSQSQISTHSNKSSNSLGEDTEILPPPPSLAPKKCPILWIFLIRPNLHLRGIPSPNEFSLLHKLLNTIKKALTW